MSFIPLQPTGSAAPSAANEQGLIAITGSSTFPATQANGNLVGAMGDKIGRAVVVPQASRDLVGAGTGSGAVSVTGASATTVISAPAAGIYADISEIWFTNTSSTSVSVQLSDGTKSYYFYAPATDMRGAAFQVPLPASSAQTSWTVTSSTAITTLYVNVIYILNK
jgi:hypothetical protein